MEHDQRWTEIIRNSVQQSMQERVWINHDLSFIAPENLRTLWMTSMVQFEQMQAAVEFHFDSLDHFLDNYVKIISIFVLIHFSDWKLVGRLIEKGFHDHVLIIELSELRSIWFAPLEISNYHNRRFIDMQYAFCPVVIEEGQDLIKDRQMRLPIVAEEPLGDGTSGTVTKVSILKTHFRAKVADLDNNPNTNTIIVARKRFRVAAQGRLEQEVLNRLRRESWKNDCIMTSFASVALGQLIDDSHDCEYNLFFKYAPSDLNKFLHGDEEFLRLQRLTDEQITPSALFTQLLCMVDALRYLHREELRMCHSDLKIDNILILPSRKHPIGQWKITDFGIASIEPRSAAEPQGWGDVIRTRYAITDEDQRRPGPYQAPEVEQFPQLQTGLRTKGDIWSLGCISVYVLVYAIGGVTQVDKLDSILFDFRDPGRQGYFYDMTFKGPVLFENLVSWIQTLCINDEDANQQAQKSRHWSAVIWESLVMPMLTLSPRERASAGQLYNVFNKLPIGQIPSFNVWHHESLHYSLRNDGDVLISTQMPLQEQPSRIELEQGQLPRQEQEQEPEQEPEQLPRQEQTDLWSQLVPRSATGLVCCNVSRQVPHKCHAIQVAENGTAVFMMSKNALQRLRPDNSNPLIWTLDSICENENLMASYSMHLAGQFILLWKRYTAGRHGQQLLQLRKYNSSAQGHRGDYRITTIQTDISVSLVAISCKGHIALRSTTTTKFELYDSESHRLLSWDLAEINYPRLQHLRGNIEAMAFDPDGEFLVVTAWNCWYRWTLRSLTNGGTPYVVYGKYSYTPSESGESECSLRVLLKGRYFVLHDQSQQKFCICVDMVLIGSGSVRRLDLTLRPKPQTIEISRDCKWIVCIMESRSVSGQALFQSKPDYLYCWPLQNGDVTTDEVPSLGRLQSKRFQRIRSVKNNSLLSPDAAIQFARAEGRVCVVVASVEKLIEIVPLQENSSTSQ